MASLHSPSLRGAAGRGRATHDLDDVEHPARGCGDGWRGGEDRKGVAAAMLEEIGVFFNLER